MVEAGQVLVVRVWVHEPVEVERREATEDFRVPRDPEGRSFGGDGLISS